MAGFLPKGIVRYFNNRTGFLLDFSNAAGQFKNFGNKNVQIIWTTSVLTATANYLLVKSKAPDQSHVLDIAKGFLAGFLLAHGVIVLRQVTKRLPLTKELANLRAEANGLINQFSERYKNDRDLNSKVAANFTKIDHVTYLTKAGSSSTLTLEEQKKRAQFFVDKIKADLASTTKLTAEENFWDSYTSSHASKNTPK